MDEARAMFSDKSEKPKKSPPRKTGSRLPSKPQGRNYRTYSSRPQLNQDQIQERIERLERKFEHDNLSAAEEEKLLNEIDKYEKMLKKN